jgi:hypothetical protein
MIVIFLQYECNTFVAKWQDCLFPLVPNPGSIAFSSGFFPCYAILYRIRKEHYASTYLLLYHCTNDWLFGQLHKCSLHHKNMRLCGFVSIRWSILSKLKKELASHFARCELTDRSVAIQILALLMWQNFNTNFLSMLSSTAYGRNIMPPHICYSIIVQMIDCLVNRIRAAYIIQICDFVALCLYGDQYYQN